ncbi:hypothetical protein S83_066754, partial [Arachis hypogaea]
KSHHSGRWCRLHAASRLCLESLPLSQSDSMWANNCLKAMASVPESEAKCHAAVVSRWFSASQTHFGCYLLFRFEFIESEEKLNILTIQCGQEKLIPSKLRRSSSRISQSPKKSWQLRNLSLLESAAYVKVL